MRHVKSIFILFSFLILSSCTNIFTPNDKGRISINVPSSGRSLVDSAEGIDQEAGKFIIRLADSNGKVIDRTECRSGESAYFEDVPAGKYIISGAFTDDDVDSEDPLAFIKKEIVVLGGQENIVDLPLKANTLDRIVDIKVHYHGISSFDNETSLNDYISNNSVSAATGVDLILNNGWTESRPDLETLPVGIDKNIALLLEDGQPVVQEKSDRTIYTVNVTIEINSKPFAKSIELYIPKTQQPGTGGTGEFIGTGGGTGEFTGTGGGTGGSGEPIIIKNSIECDTWNALNQAILNAETGKETVITLTANDYSFSKDNKITIASGKKIVIEPGTGKLPVIHPAASDGLEAFFNVEGELTLRGSESSFILIQGEDAGGTKYTINGSAIKANGGSIVNIGQNVWFSNIQSNSGTGAAISMAGNSKVNINGTSDNTVQFVGCKVEYTTATGGAIYNNGGTLKIDNAEFSGCSVSGSGSNLNGGAVYIASGSLEISTTYFEKCKAEYGGAIYLAGGTASLDSVTFGTTEETKNAVIAGSGNDLYIADDVTSVTVTNATPESWGIGGEPSKINQ